MTTYSQHPGFPPRRPSPLPLALGGAALVLALFLILDRSGLFAPAPRAEPRPVAPRGELAPLEQTFVDVFARSAPSVGHITTRTLVRSYYGAQTQEGAGSGFVWDDRGTMVTNWHVVKGAQQVQVAIGERTFRGQVLAGSPEHDLAVLRLIGDTNGLQPLPLGSSRELKVGQTVIAIGNPFGFDQTMTTGIVSALGRNLRTREGNMLAGLIQVDAAINPGNSGGPLLDSAGRLIGVTTAIYSPSGASAGIGFAVPVDEVNQVIPALLGDVAARAALAAQRPVLGIGNPTDYRLANLDLPGTRYRYGAIFTELSPGFGAATAGLQPTEIEADGTVRRWGDVIVAIDDRLVRRFDEIGDALRDKRAGQKVAVTVVRGLPDAPRIESVPVMLGKAGS